MLRNAEDRAVGTCAVVMAAYRAKRWILTTLESIREQETRDGWTYSLRIGVDGCEETSSLLLAEGEPHWFSPTNVGPYVMRNSLIELEPAEAYAVFDADDVMLPGYLASLLSWMRDGIAGASRHNIDPGGVVTSDQRIPYHSGVAVFSDEVWQRLGGYREWPIAADHDFVLRAKALDIGVTRIKQVLYHRRIHPGSLTQDPTSGYRTEIRARFKADAERLTKRGDLYVEPVTTPLEYRTP
jgi:hypothetical protein